MKLPHMAPHVPYGTNEFGEFVPGDLVMFTGWHYTPDYTTHVDDDMQNMLGIVVSSFVYGYYEGSRMYKVYWFNASYAGRVTETVAGHLRLVYTTPATPTK